jgi:hypothetical protein
MFIFLLFVIAILVAAIFVLFHHHMVNLHTWHTFLSGELASAKAELGNLRQYVNDHIHLHTAPATASPAAAAAKKP